KKLSRFPLASRIPGLVNVGARSLRVLQGLKLRKLRRIGSAGVKELVWAGPEFDQLWLQTRDLFATTNVRTSTLINWLCFAQGGDRKLLLGCFEADRLLGYLIVRTEQRPGLRELEIIDLWPPFPSGQISERLVCGALEHAEEHDFDTLSLPHSNFQMAI